MNCYICWTPVEGDELRPQEDDSPVAHPLCKLFEFCEQCATWHLPVTGVCVWRLTKDASFVLDAAGAALTLPMMARVLAELDSREGHRYVSSPEQRHAYLMTGKALSKTATWPWKETASDGAQWVTKADLPKDVLLVETSGGFGLIKTLQVRVGEGAE